MLYSAVTAYDSSAVEYYAQYFFIGISSCLTGSLCLLLDKNVVTEILGCIGGINNLRNTTKIILILNIVFFIALIFTLLCSHVEAQISNMSDENTQVSYEELQVVLLRWRGFVVTRSVLCIVGWLLSCFHFVTANRAAK